MRRLSTLDLLLDAAEARVGHGGYVAPGGGRGRGGEAESALKKVRVVDDVAVSGG